MPHESTNGMDSLPKQFVLAMRTLFDIMDDKNTGYVRLTDIQDRWRDDRTKGIPRGVMDSLRKVASNDGLLTFERFCTGLKICLLRNQVEKAVNEPEPYRPIQDVQLELSQVNKRSPPAPPIKNDEAHNRLNNWKSEDPQQQVSTNMHQLLSRKENPEQVLRTTMSVNHDIPIRLLGPPKPPRAEKVTERKESKGSFKVDDIIFPLPDDLDDKLSYNMVMEGQSRGPGDGRSAGELMQTSTRRNVRRREPRRHTLHNGIDYNLLKRMKQMEQEKDVLLEGLTAVEEAREWYLKQLGEVQEKIRYASRMGAYVVIYFFISLIIYNNYQYIKKILIYICLGTLE